ncbi:MAG TPA: hypothetical protein VFG87_18855 [Amycolatopsis sp.]|nr:hypothetical protein [Amycolatopsis sp.]
MHGRFSPAGGLDFDALRSYWGWLPDIDAAATHWVAPTLDYHPRTGLRARCGQRCVPLDRTHPWRKRPRCAECSAG